VRGKVRYLLVRQPMVDNRLTASSAVTVYLVLTSWILLAIWLASKLVPCVRVRRHTRLAGGKDGGSSRWNQRMYGDDVAPDTGLVGFPAGSSRAERRGPELLAPSPCDNFPLLDGFCRHSVQSQSTYVPAALPSVLNAAILQ